MSCQSPQGLKVFRMDPQSNTCFIIGFNMSSQLSRSGLIQAAGSPEKTVKWWSSSLTRGVVSGICLIFSPSWSRSRLAITQHSGFAGRWLSMDMGRAGQGGPSMWSCTWHLGVGSVGPKKIYVQYYHIWQEMGSSLGWIRCPLPPKKCRVLHGCGFTRGYSVTGSTGTGAVPEFRTCVETAHRFHGVVGFPGVNYYT